MTQPIQVGWNAFVASDGVVTTLTPPDSLAAEAAAVNDSGLVVGTFLMDFDGTEVLIGFTYDGAAYETILVPFPDVNTTVISGVDDYGVIVGSYAQDFLGGLTTNSFGFRATPDGGGGYTYESVDLASGTAVISSSFLSARNNSQQEVGTLREDNFDLLGGTVTTDIHGVVLPNSEVRYPDGGVTRLSNINDSGTIAGVATFANDLGNDNFDFYDVGFVVEASHLLTLPADQVEYVDVDLPGSDCTYAEDVLGIEPECHKSLQGINNAGVIVGFYDNDDAVFKGFIGTPNPPPLGDLNDDVSIDAADAGTSFSNWTGDGIAAAVPEPGSWLLLAACMLFACPRWNGQTAC